LEQALEVPARNSLTDWDPGGASVLVASLGARPEVRGEMHKDSGVGAASGRSGKSGKND
jgi:hypothetical protein